MHFDDKCTMIAACQFMIDAKPLLTPSKSDEVTESWPSEYYYYL